MIINILTLLALIVLISILTSIIDYLVGVKITGSLWAKATHSAFTGFGTIIIIIYVYFSGLLKWYFDTFWLF